MTNTIDNICNKIIQYSFYLLFIFVPLVFTPFNFELFEFNKMWATFLLAVVIVASWLIKMVIGGKITIQRTPLDFPILFFLAANIFSTIFSIDPHTSIWGYYSRFNGGLLSIISYILLYYAFVSNFSLSPMIKRLLLISLITGAFVALYGVLEHFGIDAQYWVQDVKNRIFSTLGQPNWLAAYLSILIPLAIAFGLKNSKSALRQFSISLSSTFYFLLSILLYLALLYTKSRSGFLGLWVGLIFFFAVYLWQNRKSLQNTTLKRVIRFHWYVLVIISSLGVITFIVGSPLEQVNKFTFKGLQSRLSPQPIIIEQRPTGPALETGGTESWEIRKVVWRGALDIARAYPLLGTGTETFAFAYYQFRPAAHNLTSEWDFLYNKAHNEYLNYLATTGILGFGAYLAIIMAFLIFLFKQISKSEFLIPKQIPASSRNLVIALLASYISILVSNFVGFSVVLTNLYFFLIPAFVFILGGLIDPKKMIVFLIQKEHPKKELRIINYELGIAPRQLFLLVPIILTSLFLIQKLVLFWLADVDYARGYNLSRAGQFQEGYNYLRLAFEKRGDEPIFKDELAINSALVSIDFYTQGEATQAAQFTQQALTLSNEVARQHPKNITFAKNRARLFYTLSGMDDGYLTEAVRALEETRLLAPTDAKIAYNLGLLYGQTGQLELTVKTLEETINLKPNYRDAYYALGIFYEEKGERQKAIWAIDYILKNIATQDSEATEKLLEWRGY